MLSMTPDTTVTKISCSPQPQKKEKSKVPGTNEHVPDCYNSVTSLVLFLVVKVLSS